MKTKLLLTLLCLLAMAAPASAGWVLYDDFNDGIDAEKWLQVPNNGTIDIQNNRLMISNGSTGETFIESTAIPANARGIRFEIVQLGGCENHDIMAYCRVGAMGDNVLWTNAGSRKGYSGLFTIYELNQEEGLAKTDLTATFGDTSTVPGLAKEIELLYNETAAQAKYTSNGETSTNLCVFPQAATFGTLRVDLSVTAHADSWSLVAIDNVYYYVPDNADYLPAIHLLLGD